MFTATQEIIDGHAFLYRVGRRNGGAGLWYDADGKETGDIHKLTEGNAGALPMGPHPIFRTEGYKWISVTDSLDNLRFWFSERDMYELIPQGYEILKIEVTGYRRFHFETYSHEVYSDHQVIKICAIDPGILYPTVYSCCHIEYEHGHWYIKWPDGSRAWHRYRTRGWATRTLKWLMSSARRVDNI